jgi:oligopeptide transport system permease protein
VAAFLVRRLVASVLTLFAIVTISFFLMRRAPGGPFASERMTEEVRRVYERYYGLDRPVFEQYLLWLKRLALERDLGRSMRRTDYRVNELIAEKIGYSFRLGALAAAIATVFGMLFGILAAAKRNRWPDHLAMSVSVLGVCVPNFVVGPLLVLVFSLWLQWVLPAFPPVNPAPLDWILPAVTLALMPMAYIARLTRSGILDVLGKDYIRTARAKGLPPHRVILVHALKNGVTPVVSYLGPMIAAILTGSLVVEYIFQFPGIGQDFVNAALNRDYPLMMGVLIVYSALVIVLNLAVDITYALLDPRVKVS